MKISIGEYETAKAAPLDYGTLCAILSSAQAASPTATLAPVAHGQGPSAPLSSTDHAVILFRREQGWQQSPAAMHGSFHAAATEHLMAKAL